MIKRKGIKAIRKGQGIKSAKNGMAAKSAKKAATIRRLVSPPGLARLEQLTAK